MWSRVVYIDDDPLVMSHARALLTSTDEGCCDYVQADLRDTGAILREARRTLDVGQPVAVLLLAVLHFIPDADGPAGIVAALTETGGADRAADLYGGWPAPRPAGGGPGGRRAWRKRRLSG